MTSSCKIHHLSVMNFTRYSRKLFYVENWLAAVAGQRLYKTGRMGNPHLDFLAGIAGVWSNKKKLTEVNPYTLLSVSLAFTIILKRSFLKECC